MGFEPKEKEFKSMENESLLNSKNGFMKEVKLVHEECEKFP